jgi:hypothetical protein
VSTGDNNRGRVIATMTGLLLIAGRAELLARRTWGRMVGLLELGAVIYSTGNSMADTTRNKLTLPGVAHPPGMGRRTHNCTGMATLSKRS